MKRTLATVLILLATTFAVNACSDNDNISETCDAATYVSGCTQLGAGYTVCNNGIIEVVPCASGTVCGFANNAAVCK